MTEQFAPGFRASTGAYVISMLREPVWRDMRLAERGIDIDAAGPSLYGFAGGERLLLGEDLAESQARDRALLGARRRALPALRGRPRTARRGGRAADGRDAAGPGPRSARASSA